MTWRADQMPDLRGRVAVVTGANSGIGFQAAKQLAAHGAHVVLACRSIDAAASAAARMRADAPTADVDIGELDLASTASIRAFAGAWDGPLDLLLNNAGVMAPTKLAKTADGFELQFGTNHLGHFVLTGLLLPALLASDVGARVVTVSSITHRNGTADVVEGNVGMAYDRQRSYSNSKLANLLFALQLQREFADRGLPATSTAAHPGVSATGLFSDRDGAGAKALVRTLAPIVTKVVLQSAAAGARPVLFAATAAEPGSYTGPGLLGESRGPIGPARVSVLAQDEALARKLWRVSEELTHFHYPWPARP